MKSPLIGITCSSHPSEEKYYIVKDYVKAIDACGGVPVLIPPVKSETSIEEMAKLVDGLLLSGGKDLDPMFYGEQPVGVWRIDPEKDVLEMSLAKAVLDRSIPILGICRGIQILNVIGGGTIAQHLSVGDKKMKHWQTAPDNYPSHAVELKGETKLRGLIGKDTIRVNSFHHQAVKDVAKGYRVSAVAPDGTVEAMESESRPWVIAVQFHIEYLWEEYPEFKRVFIDFVEAASAG
jgi:putative glutamine amidotransferase